MTRRVLIVEDEIPARERLAALLRRCDPLTEVVGAPPSIEEAIDWLDTHPEPDLILADVRLEDGPSLTIFERRPVGCPVVFVTAYGDHWQEALAVGGVDYLLKPVTQDTLRRALAKVDALDGHFSRPWQALLRRVGAPDHRTRLVGHRGTEHHVVAVDTLAWATTEHKLTFVVDREGRRFLVDESLQELEDSLDTASFFRVNRQILVAVRAVVRFRSAGRGRVAVDLSPAPGFDVVVPQERAARFRAWIAGRT